MSSINNEQFTKDLSAAFENQVINYVGESCLTLLIFWYLSFISFVCKKTGMFGRCENPPFPFRWKTDPRNGWDPSWCHPSVWHPDFESSVFRLLRICWIVYLGIWSTKNGGENIHQKSEQNMYLGDGKLAPGDRVRTPVYMVPTANQVSCLGFSLRV